MNMRLRPATERDADTIVRFCREYHLLEGIAQTLAQTRAAVAALLEPDNPLGRIWLVDRDGQAVGYVAISFGYSIEFGGKDAFIDELFIAEQHRGQGLGSAVLHELASVLKQMGVLALHLEVDAANGRAQHFYASAGFERRSHFALMSRRIDR